MVGDQTVYEIVVIAQWDQLKRWFAIHRDDYRLIVAELPVLAQFRLRFIQWNDLHVLCTYPP